MSIEIKVEKAYKGECIWIRYGKLTKSNIIIDSGPSTFAKGFRLLIQQIENLKEEIDLLILTHIDNDHILGFKHYIESKDGKIIKNIWLNGEGMSAYNFNQTHSPSNISGLVEKVKEKGINIETPILTGKECIINEGKITVITPTCEDILNVAKEIDEKTSLHSRDDDDYNDIDFIIKHDKFKSDKSLTNKASITFILEYDNKKLAFLGDAWAKNVIEGKNKYFKNMPIDLVKISHHGSKHNTSIDLLKALDCNKFVISTNKVVDKQTISRIADVCEKCIIYCNYNWWDMDGYFTENDKEKYIKTEKLLICEKTILNGGEDI